MKPTGLPKKDGGMRGSAHVTNQEIPKRDEGSSPGTAVKIAENRGRGMEKQRATNNRNSSQKGAKSRRNQRSTPGANNRENLKRQRAKYEDEDNRRGKDIHEAEKMEPAQQANLDHRHHLHGERIHLTPKAGGALSGEVGGRTGGFVRKGRKRGTGTGGIATSFSILKGRGMVEAK